MKIRLTALTILAGLTFASCGTDRKDASTADSNTIDTGITQETSAPNPNDHGVGDSTGLGTDTTDTAKVKP